MGLIAAVYTCNFGAGHSFLDLLQIKDKFHCQESNIICGVSAEERVSE